MNTFFLLELENQDNRCQSLNIWQDARYIILSLDKKSQLTLLRVLMEFWVTFEKELDEIVNNENEDILMKLRNDAETMESALLSGIIKEKDELPIFDVEV